MSIKKHLLIASALLLAGAGVANATQLVRECFDNCGPIAGAGNEPLYLGLTLGTSSVGFTTNGSWYVNLPGCNDIEYANNNDIFTWEIGNYSGNPVPLGAEAAPPYDSEGWLWAGAGGNNLSSYDTVNANDNWISSNWVTRPLISGIDFASGNTYYFTVRLGKNFSYDTGGVAVDSAVAFGFSDGTNSTNDFFTVGFTRESIADGGAVGYWSLDGSTDYGDSIFISTGTLGQPGYPNHNGPANSLDSGGPFYVKAVGPLGYISFGYDPFGTMVVGEITTTLGGGPATISVKQEPPGSPVDVTVPPSWDVTYTYTPANAHQVLTNLLVGMYGPFPSLLDAIRVSTNYDEVMNIETYPTVVTGAVPPYYAGTTIQLKAIVETCQSTNALDPSDPGYNYGAMWFNTVNYQWRSNGVAFVADTGDFTGTQTQTLTINNPQTTDSATFDCIVSSTGNSETIGPIIGGATNIVFGPSTPPYAVTTPVGATRWINGNYTFTSLAGGTGPLSYQWYTNNVSMGASAQSPTLALSNITAGMAASYTVKVTGRVAPPLTMGPAVLNVLVPEHNSFDEAVVTNTNGLYGYWQLNETSGTNLYDYINGNNGSIVYATGLTQGAPGPGTSNPGFSTSTAALGVNSPGWAQGPALPSWGNEMTLMIWVYFANLPVSGQGFFYTQNLNDGCGGYCDGYGMQFVDGNGQVGLAYDGTTYSSGLLTKTNTWNFVAMVIDGTNNVVNTYVGAGGAVTVGTPQFQTATDYSWANGTTPVYNVSQIQFGRTGFQWADSLGGTYDDMNGILSDAAVYYSALPPQTIYNMYLAGVGEKITYTHSGSSITFSWVEGTLQKAAALTGPWTSVVGATSPYTTPTTATGNVFYRVAR